MALGQKIVHQLELDNRGAVLERWLAHHLAELMSEADQAEGPAKTAAEQRAVDIILKLWMHRRALPEQVDPIGGYRKAISVLGRLMPESNPWPRYRWQASHEDILHDMFETLSRIVLGGVLLTQVTHPRSISETESKVLEDEEIFLQETLERWMPFFSLPPETPKFDIKIVDMDVAEESGEDQDASSEEEHDALPSDQQAARTEQSLHNAIVTNLERMQTDLSELLTRWKQMKNDEHESGEDHSLDEDD